MADQYRDGNVPAGMEPLAVAQRAFAALPGSVTLRAFRGDSACYETALLKYLVREQIAFTISADVSPELRRACTAPGVIWTRVEDRATDALDGAEIEFTAGVWAKDAPPLRYIALRLLSKQGQLFEASPVYRAVVSNRWEMPLAELIQWHWAKCGIIELTHDVTKNDLATGLPPSGKFGANAAWYRLPLLTSNALTVLRHRALPERFRHARPKRLHYEVFTVPAEIRTHARQLTARLGAPSVTVDELVTARQRLRDLRAVRPSA